MSRAFMAQTLTFNISGMHCAACVRRVTAALEKVPGVAVEDVQVGSARVRIAQEGDKTAVREAVEKTGFTVESERQDL